MGFAIFTSRKDHNATVPLNGHLFFKNSNNNILKIDYKVEE